MRRLYPEAAPASIARTLAELELRERAPAERPYVVTNFAVTIDGHATIGGLAGQIGSERDTETLMGLRERADAVLVGAGTIRAERYGRLLPDAERRSRRERKGLSQEPLAVIVSAKLDLPWDIGMFTEGGRVLIVTSADGDPPETPVSVRVDRHHGGVDLAAAMRALRSERGVRLLVSEGGPRLHGALHAAGLVDELFVTIAPKLGGGDGPRMLEGSLPGPVSLELLGLLEAEGELFARYRVES